MTAEDIRAATSMIAELITYPGGEVEARKRMRQQWQWPRTRTNRVIQAIYASWHRQDEGNRKFTKSQSIRRLESHIRQAASTKKWASVAMFENQLAKIQGTEEPISVKVDATLGPTVGAVLAGLDVELMERMAREYDELQAKAKAAALLASKAQVPDAELVTDSEPVSGAGNEG